MTEMRKAGKGEITMAKILVVDDNIENLKAAINQLEPEHEVTTCGTASEAKELIVSEKYDVVMTDVMMPGERDGQGHKGQEHIGKLIPIGLVIALLALKHDVPNIYIVSDSNHHDHPIAWAMDSLNGGNRVKCLCGYECPMKDKTKDWKRSLNGKINDHKYGGFEI